MEGRRSTDLNYVFGYPREMPPITLPTESDIVSHSLFLKREKIASKEWKQNTPLGEIAAHKLVFPTLVLQTENG